MPRHQRNQYADYPHTSRLQTGHRRTNSSRARILKWLALLFLLVAIGCFTYEPIKTALVNRYDPQITRSTIVHRNQHAPVSYNMANVKSASMKQAINARAHAKDLATVGQILVPSVGIHLPIGLGVSNQTLMLAAGTMRPHQQMGRGNYALAGHHMISKSVLFTPLYYRAHRDTRIYLTDMKTVYTYRINVRKIISPYDTGVVNNTPQPIVTLITCNDSGSKRLLMQGRLINKKPFRHAPKAIIRDANQRTNNHHVLKGY